MVIEGPHCLGMTIKNGQIYFYLQDSHHDPTSRIKKSFFQRSRGFQENHHEFYDPNTEWLEQSYLASSVVGSKFQSFLPLTKKLGADEDTLARGFLDLLKSGIHQRCKHVDWIKVVVVTRLSDHK